jgi:hypothetical protein
MRTLHRIIPKEKFPSMLVVHRVLSKYEDRDKMEKALSCPVSVDLFPTPSPDPLISCLLCFNQSDSNLLVREVIPTDCDRRSQEREHIQDEIAMELTPEPLRLSL